jgi:hypothetical protein
LRALHLEKIRGLVPLVLSLAASTFTRYPLAAQRPGTSHRNDVCGQKDHLQESEIRIDFWIEGLGLASSFLTDARVNDF